MRTANGPTRNLVAMCSVLLLGAAAGGWATLKWRGPDTPMAGPAKADVMHGRHLVLTHACGDCHGPGTSNPSAPGWLDGMRDTAIQQFQVGPFKTRARNITPDNETGIGRFSERQIFNALRYGLRPGETPDVEITSMTPGRGNFPEHPKYLAPPMPWISWRYMSDQDLWDIAAYLKRALKPVKHHVDDSEGPPDFWASAYTPQIIGTYPPAPFPTANERRPQTP